MKSVEVRKAINALDVANQAATEILDSLALTLSKKEVAHIALTGGTVGILTLDALSSHAGIDSVDFSKVHFWWGDERYVASDSKDRNAKQAREALLSSIRVPESNIHEFPSSDHGLDVDEARKEFEQTILDAFDGKHPSMDLTILGMGPDGHVASLFPGERYDTNLVLAIHNSPKPPSERLSLSMDVINASEKIIFVISGIDKAEAIESVHKNPDSDLPAAKVSATGQTLWIIDEAAGASFWSC